MITTLVCFNAGGIIIIPKSFIWLYIVGHYLRSLISPLDQMSSINISSLGRLFGTLTNPSPYDQ